VATFKARNTYTHLIIDKKGQVFQILPLDTWVRSGSSKGNSFAIGIEIVGMNEAELLQNETQFKSVIATVKWLINKFNIPNVKGTTLYNQEDVAKARGIFGHYHTDPGRKSDPGKKYMEKVWNTLGSQ